MCLQKRLHKLRIEQELEFIHRLTLELLNDEGNKEPPNLFVIFLTNRIIFIKNYT